MLDVAEHILADEIAAVDGRVEEAEEHLRRVVEIEDGLVSAPAKTQRTSVVRPSRRICRIAAKVRNPPLTLHPFLERWRAEFPHRLGPYLPFA